MPIETSPERRIVFFSAKPYDEETFARANEARDGPYHLTFLKPRLDRATWPLAADAFAVCVFVNDVVDRTVLEGLHGLGVRKVLLRCSGFNNVDVTAAEALGIDVHRVPAYSPHAVAEHAVGIILALDRKIHRAYNRVREGNFDLQGLIGFDLHGKTVGIVGTGAIGTCFARIMRGFGCEVLGTDPQRSEAFAELGGRYVPLDELLRRSRVVSLHCPLTPDTRHLMDDAALARMPDGAMLVNTSRGGLVDTRAIIRSLKSERLGALGMDVYEEEADLFFRDLSGSVLQDDLFARLLTFPNVVITGHQGFLTEEALATIARETLSNAGKGSSYAGSNPRM